MILSQEPKEGLYICINNNSDRLNAVENSNRKIAIGTPLLFMKNSDWDEYLFQDATGYHLKMSTYSIEHHLKKIPNRMPNCIEELLYPILEYDSCDKNLSHAEFIVPLFPVASIISTLFCLIFGWIFQGVIVGVVFALLPYMFSLVLFLLKKRKVCGEFLYFFKSPYRKQLLVELESLLEHNEAKEHNND